MLTKFVSSDSSSTVAGDDNWAKKCQNGRRSSLFSQLHPQTKNFAKFDKSNIARAGPFFGLLLDSLLSNDCPMSIFSGLGVDRSRFLSLGL